jgi:exo-beta-1,3-glucanase (GH17 family)
MKHALISLSCLILCLVLADTLAAQNQRIDLTKQKWYGNAVCYSGYREGQHPDSGHYPTPAQILEDFKILEKHWKLIRTYGSDPYAEEMLKVIRRDSIGLKVMLGAWLSGEPGKEQSNAVQIRECIRLANGYPDIVVAVSVGNEILVDWSDHKVPYDNVIRYVRHVKENVHVPVTVDDDFLFWRDHGARLADVVDFVSMHMYPIWGKQDIDSGLSVTVKLFSMVREALPGKPVVIGEAGWATYTEGELHAPRAGDEKKQTRYFNELSAWAEKNNVTVFFFEAFDEPWKGKGTEGHWGLFSVERKAKPAMHGWYPDLVTDQPTSPVYKDTH